MAGSLKSTYPKLALILNTTADALYGQQRAFVAAGLLMSTPGRGPGSGVPRTPESAALMTIGLLTNAGVTENVPMAESIANAVHGGQCRLTGEKRFSRALARVLTDETLAARVNDIQIDMSGGYAKILYDGSSKEVPLPGAIGNVATVKREPKLSVFMGKKTKGQALHFGAALPPGTLRKLAKFVSSFDEEPKQ